VSGSDPVRGHHRVAAILLSLDPAEATAILRNMKLDVVEAVANAMLELDPRLTEAGAVDRLYGDLARQINGPKTVHPCSSKDLEHLLSQSFGAERSRTVLHDIQERRRRERPFSAVEAYTPFEIARVLRTESPAVAALVLAHLDPSQSAEILRSFESEAAVEVVRRMATLEPPNPAILEAIALDVHSQLEEAPAIVGDSDPSRRLKQVALLLNNAPTEIEKNVIESLAEEDVAMADELREYMFTWEDIATIDKRTMQKILGTVDTKTLSIALKACSTEVEENVLGNLSSRVRDMVAEERELAGAMPISEVKAARNEIMTNIRAMIEAGEFRPNRGGDELVS